MSQHVRQRQRAQRADRIDEERVRAVEGVDESSTWNRRPAPGLYGSCYLQRRRVKPLLPWLRFEFAFARQPPQGAVGAHIIETMVVNADVRQMRRHTLECERSAQLEKLTIAGRIK